jgi:hypothetical protein
MSIAQTCRNGADDLGALRRLESPHPAAYHHQMRMRYVLIGLVVLGCGKPEQASSSQATPPQGSQAAATQDSSPAAPTSPLVQETPPAPSAAAPSAPDPSEKAVRASSADARAEIERAIAPYQEEARKTYPDAKRRFLAGLPAGYSFSVTTKLKSPRGFEVVFVKVTGITDDKITGTIASKVRSVAEYKAGDPYTFAESEVIDWVILHPDGTEEGNVVGKFLSTWQSQKQGQKP